MMNFFKLLFEVFNKKIILITFYDLGLGGVQTGLVDLANEISNKENTKVILFLRAKKKFERTALLSESVSVIYCPQFLPSLIKARYYYLLILLIFIIRPYSVFVSLEDTSLFVTKWVKKLKMSTKIIISANNLMSEEGSHEVKEVRTLFNQADSVLAVSKSTYKDLKNYFKINKPPLVYAPNWTMCKASKVRPYLKRKNDIVFLGRFDYQKQPELILNFAEELKNKQFDTRIRMYGSGELTENLSLKIKEKKLEKIVSLLPITKRAYSQLLNSKFIILTSRYEGLPFVLLEAMSAGCVILSLEAPGVSELVLDGKTGICKENVTQLADEYIKLCTERENKIYDKLQKLALKYQKRNYSTHNLKRVAEIIYK
jgi:glycosyltransferase involved in cell wall biosynthesis